MNKKKAKGLKKIARMMVRQMNLNPNETENQFKKLKTAYKAAKGQI
jgi:hypothetical protein